MATKKEIPDVISDEEMKQQILDEAATDFERINELVIALRSKQIRINNLIEFENVCEDTVTSFLCEEHAKVFKNMEFIPSKLVEYARKVFTDEWQEIKPILNELCNLKQKYKGIRTCLAADGKFIPNNDDLYTFATMATTTTISEEAKEAYKVFKHLYNATQNVSEWAEKNSITDFAKSGILKEFAEGFNFESFLKKSGQK